MCTSTACTRESAAAMSSSSSSVGSAGPRACQLAEQIARRRLVEIARELEHEHGVLGDAARAPTRAPLAIIASDRERRGSRRSVAA